MVAVMVVVATSLGGIVAGALWGPGLYNTWPFHFGFCPEGCGLCIARGKYRPVESDGDNYDRCPVVTGVYLSYENCDDTPDRAATGCQTCSGVLPSLVPPSAKFLRWHATLRDRKSVV